MPKKWLNCMVYPKASSEMCSKTGKTYPHTCANKVTLQTHHSKWGGCHQSQSLENTKAWLATVQTHNQSNRKVVSYQNDLFFYIHCCLECLELQTKCTYFNWKWSEVWNLRPLKMLKMAFFHFWKTWIFSSFFECLFQTDTQLQ